ncbi:glycosyltransferase [Empedobacter falsenii]
MKKKVFVTVFPPAENIHLVKDVGMIPYLLHKNHNYDSYVACYNNDVYKYLDTDVVGLKINFIKKRFNNDFVNIMIMLFTFKKIDIIQFYHFSMSKLLICFFFKIMTFGKGKTYIKLDANEKIFEIQYRGLKKILNRVFVKCVDLLSAETQIITDRLNVDNILDKKVEFIPNGFFQKKDLRILSIKKEQCITVANLYDSRKSSITLVKGFALFCKQNPLTNLEFILVGKFDEDFSIKFNDVLDKYPEAKNKMFLRGPIYDRKELVKLYKESKLFLFSSLTESFGFVYLEALANCCYVISTPLIPCGEISNNWKFASHFDFENYEELSKLLQETIENSKIQEIVVKGQDYVYDKYYWPKIVEKIINRLN